MIHGNLRYANRLMVRFRSSLSVDQSLFRVLVTTPMPQCTWRMTSIGVQVTAPSTADNTSEDVSAVELIFAMEVVGSPLV
ncbi:hypothetical protein PC129_g23194 [Phytophthora cactorum]|uniref:Uncharacterized protein n=1 Tax=Phytophthora cactorum TaxID=29920 RepID=A0A8T1B2Z7_9STRA|nr:hypothetical protein PC111_g23349 [Phytophthora cactorum]KAG2872638.1 hypothetical protein PC114_g26284 [Phytophthora cactorum]KAG2892766.1 hypothetical protein PC117_g23948 [Phytophthora cactorum]KAG2970915.1 hypothetical protein PC119_g23520 [Phytophthora cactorum]KAG2998678.1 hypothetical protein PC120_g21091 [Phytophthora cactorum]